MRDKSNVELHDSLFSVFWHKKAKCCEFPYGPVVRTLHFHCQQPRIYPWSGDTPSGVKWQKKKMKIEDLPLEMYYFFSLNNGNNVIENSNKVKITAVKYKKYKKPST